MLAVFFPELLASVNVLVLFVTNLCHKEEKLLPISLAKFRHQRVRWNFVLKHGDMLPTSPGNFCISRSAGLLR